MKSVFIICLLFLFIAACKKDEPPKKQYKVTAKCDSKAVTYLINKVNYEDRRTIYKGIGQQAEYDFEDANPRAIYVYSNTGLNPGESVYMAYYENGNLLDSFTFINKTQGLSSGLLKVFYQLNN